MKTTTRYFSTQKKKILKINCETFALQINRIKNFN
jgi:hypothetical protein